MSLHEDAACGVVTRRMRAGDAPEIARMWEMGLQQTVTSTAWWMQPLMSAGMRHLAKSAAADNGDMGPHGVNVEPHWSRDDRIMLVAELSDEPSVIQGCCGVKVGTSESKTQPGACVCSIWRMSVNEAAR